MYDAKISRSGELVAEIVISSIDDEQHSRRADIQAAARLTSMKRAVCAALWRRKKTWTG